MEENIVVYGFIASIGLYHLIMDWLDLKEFVEKAYQKYKSKKN